MPISEAQKKANKKWRENNHEKYNATQRKHSLNHYYANKEYILEQKKDYYQANKDKQIEYAKQYYLKKKAEKLAAKENIQNI